MRHFLSHIVVTLVVQMLSVLAGILVIRVATKEDYALYALATSLTAGVLLISDSGISAAINTLVSKHQGDEGRIAHIIRLGRGYRLAGIAFGLSLASIVLAAYALAHDISATTMIAVAILLAFACYLGAIRGLSVTHLRLLRSVGQLRSAPLASVSIRIALLLAGLALSPLPVVVLLGIYLVGSALETRLSRVSSTVTRPGPPYSDIEDRLVMRSRIRSVLPVSVFTAVQTQALFVTLGLVGGEEVLAEVAAMARFAIVFTVLNTVIADYATRSIALADADSRNLAEIFLKILTGYLCAGLVCITGVRLLAPALLTVLGPGYEGLESVLLLVACGSFGINLALCLRGMNFARGWTTGSWTYIPLTMVWFLAGLVCLNLERPMHAAIFMATQAAPPLSRSRFAVGEDSVQCNRALSRIDRSCCRHFTG